MKYKIHLLSDWHCGSGLGAGAESDNEVLKDKNGFPYIPGKTIKGLLKDALMEMPDAFVDKKRVEKVFGYEEKGNEGEVIRTYRGSGFFSNATVSLEEENDVEPEWIELLYRNIASTSINENGVAKPKTLRRMEVCMPVTLEGAVEGLEDKEEKDLIEKAMKWVRHLGVNRNRGLGRCKFEFNKT